jgi:hypothetical protein
MEPHRERLYQGYMLGGFFRIGKRSGLSLSVIAYYQSEREPPFC